MIEIKVNDEVRDVKAEVFMGLTFSQIIWIVLGVLAGFITGWAVYKFTPLPLAVAAYIAMVPAMPFAIVAFKTWHEMTMVETFKLFVTRYIMEPKTKTIGGENEEYCEHIKIQEEIRKKERKEKKRKYRRKKNGDS